MDVATPFLNALTVASQTELAYSAQDHAQLNAVLHRILQAAHAAWPSIALADDRFLSYVAERVIPSPSVIPFPDLMQRLEQLHTSDLFLCCACADGNDRAIAQLQATTFPMLDRALARLGIDPQRRYEVLGELIPHLFVADDRKPRIASYRGKGALQGWLRAVAVRHALASVPQLQEDDQALAVQPGTFDLEAQYLKTQYGPLFETAFADALRSLSVRQRNLLRRHLFDGLRIDDLALIHHVHRATVARWIERAREDLARYVYQQLSKQLGLQQKELQSLLRAIRSHIDLSLSKHLR